MSQVELEIESLSHGGEAVAHHEGQVVFVDRGVPGDRLLVELGGGALRPLRGRQLEVLRASPERVEPACALAEACGGCRWMHASPSAQAFAKERIFYDALERIGQVPRAALDAQPLAPAPALLAYRRRARLHVRQGKVGYLRAGTHALIALDACPVLEPALEQALRTLPAALEARTLLGRVKEIDLVCEGSAWSFALHVDKLTGSVRDRTAQVVRAVGARGAILLAPDSAPMRIDKPELGTLRPDVFAQVNADSNAGLVEAVMLGLAPGEGSLDVLELFAGSGNFTLALATGGAQVLAVDTARAALGLLRAAADARGLGSSIRIIEGDGLEIARALASEGRRFDALLLDPPRSGCSGLGPLVHALGIRKVVYVSCDPATLARDVRELHQAGLVPRWARPFDLFPQTPHVEGVVLLERP